MIDYEYWIRCRMIDYDYWTRQVQRNLEHSDLVWFECVVCRSSFGTLWAWVRGTV